MISILYLNSLAFVCFSSFLWEDLENPANSRDRVGEFPQSVCNQSSIYFTRIYKDQYLEYRTDTLKSQHLVDKNQFLDSNAHMNTELYTVSMDTDILHRYRDTEHTHFHVPYIQTPLCQFHASEELKQTQKQ